jgi:hypothetical protein
MAVEEDPMAWLGYHPERVEDLWRHTRAAVDDLATITSDDPAAADAMCTVRLAQAHLEGEWLPLLERIRASTALTEPGDGRSWFDDSIESLFAPREGRTVIAAIVAGFSVEEREFFQGFVNECAASVAAELSHYDAHPDYQLDVFPDELRTLDDRGEWDWLARLYLIEQYHHMVDTGAVARCSATASTTGSTRSISPTPTTSWWARSSSPPSPPPAGSARLAAAASPPPAPAPPPHRCRHRVS